MKLICLGDSLTFGCGVPQSQRWSSLFAQASGWQVCNQGINGDTTGGMLTRLDRDVLTHLRQSPDSLVFIMGGSNDIFFSGSDAPTRSNFTAIIHQLAVTGAVPVVGIPLPIDWLHTPEKWAGILDFQAASLHLTSFSAWLRDFCAVSQLPFVDFPVLFYKEDGQVRQELFLDGIHPTPEGHRLMANLLLDTLLG